MRIETHQGLFADPATVEDVARAVAGLTHVGRAYIIVSALADSEWYVQAAGPDADVEGFLVERRDGCAGDHYRGDRRLTADELVQLLEGYLRGATDWAQAISWHRVRVDFGTADANA